VEQLDLDVPAVVRGDGAELDPVLRHARRRSRQSPGEPDRVHLPGRGLRRIHVPGPERAAGSADRTVVAPTPGAPRRPPPGGPPRARAPDERPSPEGCLMLLAFATLIRRRR